MHNTFAATGISRSSRTDERTLELELADASGQIKTVRVTADMASALARTLQEFADRASKLPDDMLTKVPRAFAVGAGRFENVVLVRFEDDAPYALGAIDAMELGVALIEQAETVGMRPAKIIQ